MPAGDSLPSRCLVSVNVEKRRCEGHKSQLIIITGSRRHGRHGIVPGGVCVSVCFTISWNFRVDVQWLNLGPNLNQHLCHCTAKNMKIEKELLQRVSPALHFSLPSLSPSPFPSLTVPFHFPVHPAFPSRHEAALFNPPTGYGGAL